MQKESYQHAKRTYVAGYHVEAKKARERAINRDMNLSSCEIHHLLLLTIKGCLLQKIHYQQRGWRCTGEGGFGKASDDAPAAFALFCQRYPFFTCRDKNSFEVAGLLV